MKDPTSFLALSMAILQLSSSLIRASPFIGIRGSIGVFIDSNPSQPPPPASSSPDLNTPGFQAFQSWKSSITDDPSSILSTWVGPNVCSYKGVFCSFSSSSPPSQQQILAIDLNHADLRGTLPKELSLLTHLTILHLNSNRFSGPIPDSLQSLQHLTELDLSNNQFSGPFPFSTLLIPNLIYLDLRFNSFSGEIPEEIFAKDLDAIFLNNNQFEGEVPVSLWTSSASVITLANNRLSGSIPSSFGYVGSNLRQVLFSNNKLTGCIPESVGYLRRVEVLDLSFNSLSGKLPSSISCLSGIEVLNVAHNEFYGELSDVICDLRSLLNLTVAYNFFSGFSEDCGKLMLRNVGFDFSGNCIPGREMQRPRPECLELPGGGLSCLRTPGMRMVACALDGMGGGAYPLHNSLSSSSSIP